MIFLEDGFFDHDKVIATGDDDAVLVYLKGLAWLKQQGSTDGRIPKVVLPRLAPVHKGRALPGAPSAARLTDVQLWHDQDTHWLVHGYAERNAKAIAKSEQARAAALTRHANAEQRQKRTHSGRKSETPADADATAMRTQMRPQPSPCVTSTDTDTDTDTGTPTSTSSSSSSNGTSTPAHPNPEEEDPRIPKINQACELLAHRALTARTGPPVTDRRAWLTRVTHERWVEHADRAAGLLEAEPDLTPDQLAAHLEPTDQDADHAAYLESLKVTPDELDLRRQRAQAEATSRTPQAEAARAQLQATADRLRGGSG